MRSHYTDVLVSLNGLLEYSQALQAGIRSISPLLRKVRGVKTWKSKDGGGGL